MYFSSIWIVYNPLQNLSKQLKITLFNQITSNSTEKNVVHPTPLANIRTYDNHYRLKQHWFGGEGSFNYLSAKPLSENPVFHLRKF